MILLVGLPGTGKKRIIEELRRRGLTCDGEIPDTDVAIAAPPEVYELLQTYPKESFHIVYLPSDTCVDSEMYTEFIKDIDCAAFAMYRNVASVTVVINDGAETWLENVAQLIIRKSERTKRFLEGGAS